MRVVLRLLVLRWRCSSVLLRFECSFANFRFDHLIEPWRRSREQRNRLIGEVKVLVVDDAVRRRITLEASNLFQHQFRLSVFDEFLVVRLVEVHVIFLDIHWSHCLEVRLDEDAAFSANRVHRNYVLRSSHYEFFEVKVSHRLVLALFGAMVHYGFAHDVVLMILPDFDDPGDSRPASVVHREVNAVVDFVENRRHVLLRMRHVILQEIGTAVVAKVDFGLDIFCFHLEHV